jgi:hypothetical protein
MPAWYLQRITLLSIRARPDTAINMSPGNVKLQPEKDYTRPLQTLRRFGMPQVEPLPPNFGSRFLLAIYLAMAANVSRNNSRFRCKNQ